MTRQALIVDDSATMRNMLKAAMRDEGFEVVTAQDGVKALKAAKSSPFDIIITDINMPNMDGIELIRLLRETDQCKFTPILVVTTEGGDAAKQAGRQVGASGWMVKPFKPEVLSSAVRKLCGNS